MSTLKLSLFPLCALFLSLCLAENPIFWSLTPKFAHYQRGRMDFHVVGFPEAFITAGNYGKDGIMITYPMSDEGPTPIVRWRTNQPYHTVATQATRFTDVSRNFLVSYATLLVQGWYHYNSSVQLWSMPQGALHPVLLGEYATPPEHQWQPARGVASDESVTLFAEWITGPEPLPSNLVVFDVHNMSIVYRMESLYPINLAPNGRYSLIYQEGTLTAGVFDLHQREFIYKFEKPTIEEPHSTFLSNTFLGYPLANHDYAVYRFGPGQRYAKEATLKIPKGYMVREAHVSPDERTLVLCLIAQDMPHAPDHIHYQVLAIDLSSPHCPKLFQHKGPQTRFNDLVQAQIAWSADNEYFYVSTQNSKLLDPQQENYGMFKFHRQRGLFGGSHLVGSGMRMASVMDTQGQQMLGLTCSSELHFSEGNLLYMFHV